MSEMKVTVDIHDLAVFLKAPSSLVAHGAAVRLPYSDRRVDQEGELAAVLGRRASNVPVAEALDHVVGYTGLLDAYISSVMTLEVGDVIATGTPSGHWPPATRCP